jgi:sugar lactone lactonase YvrE
MIAAVATAGALGGSSGDTIGPFAGDRFGAFSGDGGPAITARLNSPSGVAVDDKGNVYIADTQNHRVRKVNPGGTITTFAGRSRVPSLSGGGLSGDGGPAISAELNSPLGVAVDGQGNVYIADTQNHRVRKVNPGGTITTIAGTGSGALPANQGGFSGDGGPATAAQLSGPRGVAVDGQGNVYIADYYNNRVRKVNPGGTITTIAGTGVRGDFGDGGNAISAQLDGPTGVAVDGKGNVYVVDHGNDRLRKVSPGGKITSIAGTGRPSEDRLLSPTGVAVGRDGSVYIADTAYSRVRRVSPSGTVSTFAGEDSYYYYGCEDRAGPALHAAMREPTGVAVDTKGNVYIADYKCQIVSKVTVRTQAPTVGNSAKPRGSSRTHRLRWPAAPGRTVTYHLRFRSPHVRAIGLKVYGKTVRRGFGFDFIVACEHRGPAILNWDWAQSDGYVRITVRMTTGTCEPPGPTVAGTYAEVTVRSSSGGSSASSAGKLPAGRWTGRVKQSNIGSRFSLTLTLPSAPRVKPGRVEIPAAGCVGTVRYLRTDVSGRFVFAITWQRGRCSTGTMWVTTLGRDSLSYRWKDGRGTISVATLRRIGTSTGTGAGSSSTAKLRSFVDRVENVLAQSAAGRRELGAALAAGFNCSISPRAAGQRIASVVDNRQSILGQLGSLAAPNQQAGEALRLLRLALRHSIDADIHYRDGFFGIVTPGCPLPSNANFKLATKSDVRATTAKQRFVAAFDPLAKRLHRRTWSAGEI